MTYLSDRSRARTTYKYYILFIVLFSLLVYKWPTIRVAVYPYVEPVVLSYSWAKITTSNIPSFVYTYFTSHSALVSQNKLLELNIERLENELAEKDSTIKENELTKIGEVDSLKSTIILYPIMQGITKVYSTIILSKGFKDGVEDLSIVYLRGRQAVCIITEVHDKTSLCRLLSASGEVIEGIVMSSTIPIMLTLKGTGGGSFIADVPRDTEIPIGGVVSLRSEQTMILGTVTSVVRDEQASSWYVYVRGAYNPVTSNVFYISK
jgi:cell shape-determining protein MreC